MIPNSIKKRVVEETNIVEVVGEYVKLHKKGNSYFGLCPFHDDKNPSMSVSNKVKMFNCFSCNTKGNVITFVSKYENITPDQATIKLAKRLGITVKEDLSKEAIKQERLYNLMKEAKEFYRFYLRNSVEGQAALDYLHKRGISDEIIDQFEIGLSPNLKDGLYQFLNKKGFSELDQIELGLIKQEDNGNIHDVFRMRVMFPLLSNNGQVVGFSGRIYTESNQAKYINSNENIIFHKGEVLYNMHKAARIAQKMDKIYLFEGFMDVIAASRCGIDYGVATMGTALTKEHIKSILQVTKNIVLCFDGDEAGIKAMKRSTLLLSDFNIIPEAVVLPDNQDPDEYIKAHGKNELNTFLISKAKPVYHYLYLLAYKDVIKSDVRSVENFKRTVFDFISLSKQNTIVDYYLSKMATDLGVDVNSLKNDYSKFKPVFNNNVFIDESSNNNKEIIETIKAIRKPLPVTKGVRRAYEIIIKNCIYDSKKLDQYFKETDKYYPGNDLLTEFSVLSALQVLNNELYVSPDLVKEKDRPMYIIEKLKQDETLSAYVDKIINDEIIDINKTDDFNQSLIHLKKFIKKRTTRLCKNRILSGDKEAIDEFTKSKKEENNI